MSAYPFDPPYTFSDCGTCGESTDQRDLSRHGHRWLCPTCSDREDNLCSGCGEREAETPPMPSGDAFCVQCLLMLGAFLGAA